MYVCIYPYLPYVCIIYVYVLYMYMYYMYILYLLICMYLPIFTNPSAWDEYDTRSILKLSLTGLNIEFSFS